jgi:hypothetical protein
MLHVIFLVDVPENARMKSLGIENIKTFWRRTPSPLPLFSSEVTYILERRNRGKAPERA